MDKLYDELESIKSIVESNYGLYVIQKLIEKYEDPENEKIKVIRQILQ